MMTENNKHETIYTNLIVLDLSCCDQVDIADSCRSNCTHAAETIASEDAMIDEIIGHCGDANPAVRII